MTIKAQTCHTVWDLLLFSLSFIYTSTPSSHCFLFLAGGKTSDPCGQCHDGFLWSQLCFVSKRQCSAGERVPCSGKPGAISASAAPSPGDWPNISWLHLAVLPWYGHITSAHSPVTEPALPTLNILQQSLPFQVFSCIWAMFGHISHSHCKLRACYNSWFFFFSSLLFLFFFFFSMARTSPAAGHRPPHTPPQQPFLLLLTTAFEFPDNRLWLLAASL